MQKAPNALLRPATTLTSTPTAGARQEALPEQLRAIRVTTMRRLAGRVHRRVMDGTECEMHVVDWAGRRSHGRDRTS